MTGQYVSFLYPTTHFSCQNCNLTQFMLLSVFLISSKMMGLRTKNRLQVWLFHSLLYDPGKVLHVSELQYSPL